MSIVKKIKVRGKDFKVSLSESGHFTAVLDDAEYSHETLKGLEEKLVKATRMSAARVSIPFVRWYDGRLRHGLVTGIHAANKNLLIKWADEKGVSQEYPSYGGDNTRYLSMTPEEVAEYTKLEEAAQSAREAADAFAAAHKFNALAEVTRLLNEQPEEKSGQ